MEVSGEYSLNYFMFMIREVARHCEEEKLEKALIDLRQVTGDASILDRYELGVEMARVWGSKIMVAGIGRVEVMNRMAEHTAVNRGARVLATVNMQAALIFLGVKESGTATI